MRAVKRRVPHIVLSEDLTLDFSTSPVCWKFIESDAAVRIIVGPVGSGKTFGCCGEVMRRALQQKPGPDNIRYFKCAIVRNTMPELWRTTMETWLSLYPEEKVGNLRRSSPVSHTIKIPENKQTGEPGLRLHVDFFALDKEKDVKSLLSYEGTMIWFNEVREIPKKLVDAATDRVGRYPSMKKGGVMPTWHGVIGDTNPPDEDHWIYKFHKIDPQVGYDIFQQPPGVLEAKFIEDQQIWKSIDVYNPRLQTSSEKEVIYSAGRYWIANPDAENLINLPVAFASDSPLAKGKYALKVKKNPDKTKKWYWELQASEHNEPGLPRIHEGDTPLEQGGYYLKRCSGKSKDWITGYYQGRYGPIFDGKPVIPDFNREFMVVDSIQYIPELPIGGGIDIGGGTLSPACVFGQRSPRGIYYIFGEYSPPDEAVGAIQFCAEMKSIFAHIFPEGKWGRFSGDPAGETKDPLFAFTMFSHLQSQGIPAKSASGGNDPRNRIEAIKAPTTRLVDGMPGLIIHPRCKMLIAGLQGGWKFKRVQSSGEERYQDTPSKNKYSHVCDALGYYLQGAGEGKAIRFGPGHDTPQKPMRAKMDFNAFK